MSDGFESVGAGVGDAMLARVVEPGHGEPSKAGTGPRCLNCGTYLTGAYCQGCGQKAHLHRSIGDFWHDFLHGVLHFDGKFWRTLPLLAWHPGELTRRYIHGERARFISPLALFLFAVFLTFAAFHNIGEASGAKGASIKEQQGETLKQVQKLKAEVARLDQAIVAAKAAGKSTQRLENEKTDAQTAINLIETVEALGIPATSSKDADDSSFAPVKVNFGDGKPKNQSKANANANANANGADTVSSVRNESLLSTKTINYWIDKIRKNPELLAYKMQGYAYKYAWALIPISALWLWLLYALDRRFLYYDHIVFVTYSIAFMMLLGTSLLALTAVGLPSGLGMGLFTLGAPIHMYRQLREAYRSTILSTVVRTILLVLGALFILLIFAAMLFGLGLG